MGMGVGMGVVEVRDLDNKRITDAPTARWTIRSPKHAPRGNELRAEMAILVVMTALEETMLEEVTRMRATIAGSQAILNMIVFSTKVRRKHDTEFAQAQGQLPALEIKISSDYLVMLSLPRPPPIQLWSLIPGPFTICAIITTLSSPSRDYADICSLNMTIITL